MNIRDIPVRVIGPGSQPTGSDGDAITYMDMPNDMSRFVAPVMPEPEDVLLMDGAREAMDWLRSALDNYEAGDEPVLVRMHSLNPLEDALGLGPGPADELPRAMEIIAAEGRGVVVLL